MPRSALIALAACSFALPSGSDNVVAIQLTPTGDFLPWDGRDIPSGHWHIDRAVASRVITRFNARKNDRVLDYEHQTLLAATNGQPAPAAGWIKGLEWREGEGLFGTVELTARARQAINDGEYKYVSPVFSFDKQSGDVLDIQMAAITNNPAIDGMGPLALRAAATFGINLDEETPMNKLLVALCAALTLSATTTEDEAIAALTARLAVDPLADVRKALGAGDSENVAGIVAACTALKSKADASSVEPDPAKFVSITAFDEVKNSLAVLTAKQRADQVNALVETGLADGRLVNAQKQWAEDLGKSNLAALTAYLDTAQPIAALSSTQTRGRKPAGGDIDGSDPAEVANRATKYQADQAAVGIAVTTAQAVDFVIANPAA
jgi:phage I-like protein